ncbi:MAG: hypothetical protein L0Y55_19785, partial [Anaerolineales bacterium]|nr:hypothetical protein [Anaerolineales bacterium]
MNDRRRAMTGVGWLDWATMTISLHNTILLTWLGLTVWLTAERRTRGIWFVGGALFCASAFFFSHSALLNLGLHFADTSLDFWWRGGWIPVLILPFGWYAVALWYSGFFAQPASELRRRQRVWFSIAALLTLALGALLAFANPLPSIVQLANLQLESTPALGGLPILLALYVIDIFLCVLLSLDALRHPAPSPRVMGERARQRARPWFIATAIILLGVGLLVALAIVWITANARQGLGADRALIVTTIGWFDLVIAILIAASILCVGQAVALYEVFTGKALPRRGLVRHWRNAVILALGYSSVVAGALTAQLQPIYIILLTTALLAIFYALLGWRTYVERERYVRDLRPFVASERLYDQLLTATPAEVDVTLPFRAVCRDVLGARAAILAAVGSFAPLVPTLAYPDRAELAPPTSDDIARLDSPQTMCVQLDARRWMVPLWSARGLIGVLTLGEKSDGGVYSQEEIEIARASGERLIDARASAELARRLMALQRQRIAETQLLDQRARRVLHDDILPQLHAAMLSMATRGEGQGTLAPTIEILTNAHRQISNLLRDRPATSAPEVARLGLVGALQRVVDEEWRSAFDCVNWNIAPDAERVARALPALTAETLFYAAREAIRNAARYGRGDTA